MSLQWGKHRLDFMTWAFYSDASGTWQIFQDASEDVGFGSIARKLSSKSISCWAPVAHICYPSYSEGRDQEDHSSRLAPGKKFSKSITKKGWQSGSSGRTPAYQVQGPECKSQYQKTKKKKKTPFLNLNHLPTSAEY
jgi:hypothetical protein